MRNCVSFLAVLGVAHPGCGLHQSKSGSRVGRGRLTTIHLPAEGVRRDKSKTQTECALLRSLDEQPSCRVAYEDQNVELLSQCSSERRSGACA